MLDALRRIIRTLRRSAREAEQQAGVSGAQAFVLQQLAAAPARSVNELAARTLTDHSSVSVVVSRLVERGYVTRSPSAEDARRVVMSVTPAGRAALRRVPEAGQARLIAALASLQPHVRRQLADGMVQLVNAIDAAASRSVPRAGRPTEARAPRGARQGGPPAPLRPNPTAPARR